MGRFWFWFAILSAVFAILVAAVVGFWAYENLRAVEGLDGVRSIDPAHAAEMALFQEGQIAQAHQSLITVGALVVAALANFFGIIFGWRKDRREAKEYRLRIADLERRLDRSGS